MIKIKLVCVGNLKDKFFIDACEEYEKRLTRFCTYTKKELKEYTNLDNIEQIKEREGEEILKNISGFVVLLDLKGKSLSSVKFAKEMQDLSNKNSEITFVVGGSYGVSSRVFERANIVIKMSDMTFPHRLFRVMLLEQIYRTFTIINGINYHK